MGVPAQSAFPLTVTASLVGLGASSVPLNVVAFATVNAAIALIPVTIPMLITPTTNVAIEQNNPAIGCPPQLTAGFGFRIVFDWTDADSLNGIAGYNIFAMNSNVALPIVDTFVVASEFTLTSCNAFVIDANLEGWEWSVQAQDNLGNLSQPSATGMFRFAPCRLVGGIRCFVP